MVHFIPAAVMPVDRGNYLHRQHPFAASNGALRSWLDTREEGPIYQAAKCEQLPLYKTCAMRNEMRTLLAAAAFAVAGAAAQAADVAALVGHVAKLDADSSALVYYTAAPDG